MKKYSFITAFTMIIGICIGSGIFFKADDILEITGGNILLGIILLLVGALCVIFCGLAMGKIAENKVVDNGITSYFEMYYGKKIALAFDRFFSWLYLPSILIVIAWVSGIYLELFLERTTDFTFQIISGGVMLTVIYIINLYSMKSGEYFQNFSTVIKLIPLIIIGIVGLTSMKSEMVFTPFEANRIPMIIPALLPIAFLFDGWSISTTITDKIENPTKSMKNALSFSPMIILLIYIVYFVGISSYIGVENVISLKNAAVFEAGNRIFGIYGGKIISFIVLISVLGGVNGLVIGFINTNKITLENKKTLKKSGILVIWMFIHFVVTKFNLIGNSDISEISVVFSYFLYAILFVKQCGYLLKNRNIGYLVITMIAIIFNIILIVGSFYVSPLYTLFFFGLCLMMMLTTITKV